ncbi:methionine adenosyltransferase [Pelagicoccus sp. SDUM812002]|uniref:methionine adenosyltransferase n=1 Tax=Pelagicoccus sp. SDUM812002 TaxID=3041266 RepID=UPI00280CBC12|nr:methionine adenosyltransferase [Pelagicoccus sp. SDUM812002]MDQ8184863.1 methionine adenosyltransferase [Pelagicoccus sp. SDUM812002]
MPKNFVFSSESVAEGHPDKVSDYISDSVLDACLEQDPTSRVACETLVKSNMVTLAGEITTKAKFDYEAVVRQAIREIGYVNDDDVFHADTVFITNYLTSQSPDIAQGVDAKKAKGKDTAEQGAGDQGIMFGYACNETPELMPAALMFSHIIGREIARVRHGGRQAKWLRPDCKSQVSVRYEEGKLAEITAVVISTQHADDVSLDTIKDFMINKVIKKCLPKKLLTKNTQYLINPTGRFVLGGPQGDAGLTGRKIIVDTYGGWGRHGGGAFSGKDPSKVDRSAAYMCRWVAKNIVAAGLATHAELQVAYAIGYPEPVSITVETFETNSVPEEAIEKAVAEVFSFKPANIVKQLNLLRPIYRSTTNYGHFGKDGLPWEETNKVEALKKAVKKFQ